MPTARQTIAAVALLALAACSAVLASPDAHDRSADAGVAQEQIASDSAAESEIASGFFEIWKQLATARGKEALIRDKRGVVAACIPWQRLQRVPGGLMFFIDHWWQYSKQSPAENRRSALDSCEKWGAAETADCSCHVIAENLSPALKVPPARLAALQAIPETAEPIPVTDCEDPMLSAERGIPILRDAEQLRRIKGMQGRPWYLGAGKTVSIAADPALPQGLPRLVVSRGHNEPIFLARWSLDGSLIASGGSDNRVLLWRSADLKLVADLRGHADIVDALAFSPDGKMLASGAQDGVVMLWDLTTGRRVDTLTARRGRVGSVAFSADGRLFAAYGDHRQGTAVEWRRARAPASGWTAVEIPKADGFGAAVDWRSRVGMVGEDDGALFDPDRGQWRVPGKAWTNMAGVFGLREGLMAGRTAGKLYGSAMLAASDANQIQISKDDGGSISRRIDAYSKGWIGSLTFSPNGVLLASAGEYGTLDDSTDKEKDRIKIWPVAGGAPAVGDGSSVFAFSPDNRLLAGGYQADNGLRIWDAATGRMLRETDQGTSGFSTIAVSPDGSRMAIARGDGEIHLWNLSSGRLDRVLRGHPGTIKGLRFDPSGRTLVASGRLERYLSTWDTRSGSLVWALTPKDPGSWVGIDDVAFTEDGAAVEYMVSAAESSPLIFTRRTRDGQLLSRRTGTVGTVGTGAGGARLITVPLANRTEGELGLHFRPTAQGRAFELHRPAMPTTAVLATVYSPGGHFVGVLRQVQTKDPNAFGEVNLTVWDTVSGFIQADFRATGVHSIAIANEGSIVGGQDDGRVLLWQKPSRDISDTRGWEETELARSSSSIRDVVATPGGLIGALGDDGLVRLWRNPASREPITVNSVSEAKWLVTRPDGRFDAADPDNLEGFNWVMPDDPFRPLSPSIFMRDFFEPQLLAHAMTCIPDPSHSVDGCIDDAPPPRTLTGLNRVAPVVRIDSVRRGARANEAIVTVTALGASDPSQPNRRTATDAYDLRLFRDGQLVGHWAAGSFGSADRDDLAAWRSAARISGTRRFAVRLPAAKAGQKIRFQAYAFNEDRVKGEPVSIDYKVPAAMPHAKPKAYVIAIGVDRYASAGRPLNYASKDAEATATALSKLKGYEVIAVPLISDSGRSNASKAKIRAALAVLAGRPADLRLLSEVPNAAGLRKATPDDIVILTYSGHGYTDPSRHFFLVPADAVLERPGAPQATVGLISSDELTDWLEDVDAGQIAIIIDACYSAQSVEGQGFRAGPMGDPGLGQLAYDKGIRILAATQADDVAFELGILQHGLLTYALVQEGLGLNGCGASAEQDTDGVTLDAWLRYAEQRTPSLYEDARAGRIRRCGTSVPQKSALDIRDARPDPNFSAAAARAQTPVLFDFNRSAAPIVIRLR